MIGRAHSSASLPGQGWAVVASIVPAEQAGRVPALVALRQDPVAEGRLAHPARRRLAAVIAIGGAGLVIGALIGGLPAGVVAGVVLLVVGIAGLGQAASAFSAGALGWPIAKMWGFTGALGRQNAVRHPGRTAASAAAVVVGVALICALAVIASSARASSNDELSRTVLANYVLTAAGAGPSGGGPAVVPPMAPGVVARLRAEPGVGVVSPSSYLTFSVDSRGSDWGATIDLSTYSRVVGLGPLQGSLAGLRRVSRSRKVWPARAAGTSARCCRSPSSLRTAAQKSLHPSPSAPSSTARGTTEDSSSRRPLLPKPIRNFSVTGVRQRGSGHNTISLQARCGQGSRRLSRGFGSRPGRGAGHSGPGRRPPDRSCRGVVAPRTDRGYLGIVTNLTLSITERSTRAWPAPRPCQDHPAR